MKNNRFRPFLVVSCVLALTACGKKNWKETVATEIHMSIENPSIFFGVNEFHIDTIMIDLQSFVLDGSRIQADNIHLPKSINQQFIATDLDVNLVTSFDIPQGTYESLQLAANVGSPTSTIHIIGTYTLANNTVKKVVLNLNYDQYLLQDLVEDSSNPISIDKDFPGIIDLIIDPNIMFSNLNPSYWSSASSQNVNGQEVITVSNSSNSNMYNAVHSEIGESISFTFFE